MIRMCLAIAFLVSTVLLHHASGQSGDNLFLRLRPIGRQEEEEQQQVAVSTPEDPDGDGIVGVAVKDYPILKKTPVTSFTCHGRMPGMYADLDTRCQVYHICQADLRKESVLCVNGTVFNQETFSCDWWYNVDCRASPRFYDLNADLGKPPSLNPRRHPQLLRRKSQKESLPIPPPPPPPPTIFLPEVLLPPPKSELESLPVPQFSPSPPPPRLRLKPLTLPQIPKLPELTGSPPPPPSSSSASIRSSSFIRHPAPKLRRPSSATSPQSEGQYLRDAFDPARHLPKPKPISAKKLAKLNEQRSSKPRISPMMQPVKSDDTLSGYSDFYLNKPVDED